MPLGSGAAERLAVWIRTRPASADPTSIATLHDEAIAQMAIALRLITLAFGPVVGRNVHSLHNRAHGPSLGASGRSPTKRLSMVKRPARARGRRLSLQLVWFGSGYRSVLGCAHRGLGGEVERRQGGV